MAKAAEAFRTISEVAEELDLHKHVLRFWEVKFPQIKPMKRGGGRRYYRPADLELLRGIRHLLHSEGYTIKGVQRILRERGIDIVKRVGAEVSAGAAVTAVGAPEPGAGADRQSNASKPRPRSAPPRKAPAAATTARASRDGADGSDHARAAHDGAGPAARRRSLSAVISELEDCRAILTGASAPAAAVTAASAKRAVRAAG